jgi:hypothetical protein
MKPSERGRKASYVSIDEEGPMVEDACRRKPARSARDLVPTVRAILDVEAAASTFA